MELSRRRVLAVTGSSIVIAGCLGDDDTNDSTPPADDDEDSTGQEDDSQDDNNGEEDNGESDEATVLVRSHPDYGDILVGQEEMTLYNFDADTQGEGESACYDDCAENWPALTVEESPVAGGDVTAELETIERDDGTTQVTADGWPLYYFAGDEDPGDTAGQGINDVWWVLRPDGTPITDYDETEGDDDEEDDHHEEDADATVTVGADGHNFEPDSLEVAKGETVAFVWEDGGHNVVVTVQPDEASWGGVDETQDEGYTHTHIFDVSGDYEYVCQPHEAEGMVGSIHVLDGDEPEDDGGYGY